MRNRRVLPLHHALLRPLLLVLLCLLSGQSLQAQTDKPVILVFGDSLSAGYRMDESDGWVALLAERLQAQNSPFAVVNASVSGETTDGGLARLPAALSTHMPAVVILELGGNDGLRGLPVANIRRNLEEMVMMSQAAGAQVILAGMQIPPNYGPRYTGPFTALFGEIAAERNLPLIPFLIDGIPQQPELMQDDGIHPRAEAQPLIVDIVWPVLEPVLQALQPSS